MKEFCSQFVIGGIHYLSLGEIGRCRRGSRGFQTNLHSHHFISWESGAGVEKYVKNHLLDRTRYIFQDFNCMAAFCLKS